MFLKIFNEQFNSKEKNKQIDTKCSTIVITREQIIQLKRKGIKIKILAIIICKNVRKILTKRNLVRN